jgi:hypothetical protein
MGCGCKNKGNETQTTTTTTNTNNTPQTQSAVVKEDVKSAIKKTIEKYYNVNKTTNGWVRE